MVLPPFLRQCNREITAHDKRFTATHTNFRSCRVSSRLKKPTTFIEIAVYQAQERLLHQVSKHRGAAVFF